MTEGCVHDILIACYVIVLTFLACPLGEGAERSEAEGENASYVFKIYEGEKYAKR